MIRINERTEPSIQKGDLVECVTQISDPTIVLVTEVGHDDTFAGVALRHEDYDCPKYRDDWLKSAFALSDHQITIENS